MTERYVVVHFLTPSLGEHQVRVDGPYESKEEATANAKFTRADVAVKVVPLGG